MNPLQTRIALAVLVCAVIAAFGGVAVSGKGTPTAHASNSAFVNERCGTQQPAPVGDQLLDGMSGAWFSDWSSCTSGDGGAAETTYFRKTTATDGKGCVYHYKMLKGSSATTYSVNC